MRDRWTNTNPPREVALQVAINALTAMFENPNTHRRFMWGEPFIMQSIALDENGNAIIQGGAPQR